MATAIWQDYIVNLGTTDGVTYTVYDNDDNTGNVIYTGKAYKRPGETYVYVKVNDICADYLRQQLPCDYEASLVEVPATMTVPIRNKFSIYVGTTKIDDFSLYLNYDYASTDRTNQSAHEPITGRLEAYMPVFLTVLKNHAAGINVIEKIDGVAQTPYVTDAALPGNIWTTAPGLTAEQTSKMFNVATEADPGKGVTYKILHQCHHMALYYVNAYGGWDALLLEGKCRRTDGIKRSTINVAYDNNKQMNGGLKNYQNDITVTWELHTGWLTDAEASRMHHLLGSAQVYLCTLHGGWQNALVQPVVLTNADCPHKINRDGMVQYTLTAQLAQSRPRR